VAEAVYLVLAQSGAETAINAKEGYGTLCTVHVRASCFEAFDALKFVFEKAFKKTKQTTRIRDNSDSERQFAEIRLRCQDSERYRDIVKYLISYPPFKDGSPWNETPENLKKHRW